MDGNEGTCTEDGAGLRIYYSSQGLSGYNFTVRYNRFERIGANGVMMFGYGNTVQYNVFSENCYSKGDCGAVNTFGGSSLAASPVHDITIANNIIKDTIGNTDGTHPNFRALFAFGLYIDQNSRAVTSDNNTILRSTVHGILYQNSSGSVTNNVVVDNNSGSMWGDQVALVGSTTLTNFSGNIMVSRTSQTFNLGLPSASQVAAASNNRYDHALRADSINLNGQAKTLAQWQIASGKDAGSVAVTGDLVNSYFLISNETRSDQVYDFSTWPTCSLNGAQITAPLIIDSVQFEGRLSLRTSAAAHISARGPQVNQPGLMLTQSTAGPHFKFHAGKDPQAKPDHGEHEYHQQTDLVRDRDDGGGFYQDGAHRVKTIGEGDRQRNWHQINRERLHRELRAGEETHQVAGDIHQGVGLAHQEHDCAKGYPKTIQADQHGYDRDQRQQGIAGRVKPEKQTGYQQHAQGSDGGDQQAGQGAADEQQGARNRHQPVRFKHTRIHIILQGITDAPEYGHNEIIEHGPQQDE